MNYTIPIYCLLRSTTDSSYKNFGATLHEIKKSTWDVVSQQTFTCSKLTIETLEKKEKYVQN